MKLDTSSYYPKSPLESDEDYMPKDSNYIVDPEDDQGEIGASEDDNANLPQKDAEKPDERLERLPSESENAVDRISNVLSWVFVPLVMPVYGILLAFNISILDFASFNSKLVFTLITAAFNVVIPVVAILILKKMNLIDDIGLNGRKERLIPYIITIICLVSTGIFLWFKHAPEWLVMFFAGGAVAGLINLLINFWWKISAHAAGLAGIVALLLRIIHDGFPQQGVIIWLIVAIIISGLVGSARVWLGRHTVMQVLAGFLVGFLSVFFMTMV